MFSAALKFGLLFGVNEKIAHSAYLGPVTKCISCCKSVTRAGQGLGL